jgi:hypothetical protein
MLPVKMQMRAGIARERQPIVGIMSDQVSHLDH